MFEGPFDDLDRRCRANLRLVMFKGRTKRLPLHSSVAPVNFSSAWRHGMWRSRVYAVLWVAAMCHAAHSSAQDNAQPRTEFGGFPLVGGDTDLGIGGGAFASIARFEPGYEPYRFRLELAGAITFKPSDSGLTMPYRDIYLLLTLPDLIPHRLRLEVRPAFTSESTLAYSGIGNGAPAPVNPPPGQTVRNYFQYGLTHPSLLLRVRLTLTAAWRIEFGEILSYDSVTVHEDSLLARDLNLPALKSFFGPLRPHWVNLLEYTLLYDTRNRETSTLYGMHHQLRLRLSPGGVKPMPYRYGQVNLTLRAFHTLGRVTFAARVVFDSQFGQPPFYELPRYEDTFALGGANGVRGIPAQRYYGPHKLFGNVEARMLLSAFRLIGLPCKLQGVTFFDAGRLWSSWPADPALDGRGIGLKWGAGAGLRLQQGEAFVIRADVAWSPDARPLGAYVTAGQVF
jgi:hypothetical protein